ncbi:MAG TPA: hypothetical protein DHV69_00955 [Sphaerochaeta sp.]|nr:MAG: hypothetical protein A2Y31_00705 [Spirochaetes bacterium GWC2_52_13]OHD62668.1 MAG: hypothetical protein A2101_06945 [Spirochaetes bacterium GWF2_52_7]PKL22492.1 MAG: hypothetical protein CVV48_02385 [Spirochaetae bacterium HGW-Spirochaetae-4]HCG64957.1 hypothetical protein [Sphaerochaeta sp.]HCJ93823.1 hypothetical protein [Sphaerochaeta sp.]
MEQSEIFRIVKEAVKTHDGLLRMRPSWVARTFLEPGKRLGLKEHEYPVGKRGFICERWLGSETEVDNEVKFENEGLSLLDIPGHDILLRDAVQAAKTEILGAEYAKNHKNLLRLAKIYDYKGRIFYHFHQTQEEASKVGATSKEEAYYYPEGVDLGPHPETFFGVHPYIVEQNKQYEILLPCLKEWDSELILQHSRAYLNVPGEGFHLPAGVLHAPGSALTIELQEPSDVMSVFQSNVEGKQISKELLFKDVEKKVVQEKQEKAVLDQLNWDINGDPYFYENRHTPPILIEETATEESQEYWIYYNTTRFSGKKLVVKPHKKVLSKDMGVYNILVWKGRGKADDLLVEGQNFGKDELLVVDDKARKGVLYENTGDTDLVILKFFGPDINNSVIPFIPKYPEQKKS